MEFLTGMIHTTGCLTMIKSEARVQYEYECREGPLSNKQNKWLKYINKCSETSLKSLSLCRLKITWSRFTFKKTKKQNKKQKKTVHMVICMSFSNFHANSIIYLLGQSCQWAYHKQTVSPFAYREGFINACNSIWSWTSEAFDKLGQSIVSKSLK